MSVLNLVIVAVAHPRLLADSTDSMDLANVVLKSVPSIGYLSQGHRTALAIQCSQEFSERESEINIVT